MFSKVMGSAKPASKIAVETCCNTFVPTYVSPMEQYARGIRWETKWAEEQTTARIFT
jgi:hypothetical protein